MNNRKYKIVFNIDIIVFTFKKYFKYLNLIYYKV